MKKSDEAQIFYHIMNSPIGKLGIIADDRGIQDILFESELDNIGGTKKQTPLLKEATAQLKEYFEGKRKTFDLPLTMQGTDFQTSVWKALIEIPYGETKYYSQIAQEIGNPKAARAIGLANNKNRIPILIPCHRVIGKNGALVGYAGGMEIKEILLQLEAKHTNKI